MKPAVLAPRARRDLHEASQWIARNNPTAARALRTAIHRVTRLLGEHPRTGRKRPDITSYPVRFLVLPGTSYVIVYDAEVTPPLIHRVPHGSRDLPGILEDDA